MFLSPEYAIRLLERIRVGEIERSVREGELPPAVLTEEIVYDPDGLFGEEATIPFSHLPPIEPMEVEAVARHFAGFVYEHTESEQRLQAAYPSDEPAFWLVGHEPGEINYYVRRRSWGSNPTVVIHRDKRCKLAEGTLERYVSKTKDEAVT